jgi:hypothetical protein
MLFRARELNDADVEIDALLENLPDDGTSMRTSQIAHIRVEKAVGKKNHPPATAVT